MARLGHMVCMSVPLLLTSAALICLLSLVIPSRSPYLLKIDTANFSISATDLESDLTSWFDKREVAQLEEIHLVTEDHVEERNLLGGVESAAASIASVATSAVASVASDASNAVSSVTARLDVTASDLGLADAYIFGLWKYCAETGGTQDCGDAQFDYITTSWDNSSLRATMTTLGYAIPDDVDSAVSLYGALFKYTETAYIVAATAVAAQILVGTIAMCCQVRACCSWVVSGITNLLVIAASILATVIAKLVVGIVTGAGSTFGLGATANQKFLAVTWLAVGLSLSAVLFSLFTACCTGYRDGSSRKIDFKRIPDSS